LLIVTLASLVLLSGIIIPGRAEAVTGTIAVGVNPAGIGVDTSTNTVYVSNYGLNGTFPSTVSVINGSTNSLTGTITVGVNPAGVGANSVTHRIYIANYNSSNVSVINGVSNTTTTIPVGTHPSRVGVNPTTNEIYVTNSGTGTVSVINGTTNTVTATIPVGRSPVGIGVIPSTNEIYVSNSQDNSVSVIDGRTNTVIKSIIVGNDPGNIAANPATNTIYVANSNSSSGTVSVIAGSTNMLVATIPVGAYLAGIDANSVTNKIYVASSGDGTISVIDGFTSQVVNVLFLSSGTPGTVGVDTVTNEIYFTIAGRRTVSVISGHSTTTSVSCNPSTQVVNANTICTATVTDTSGTGASTPTGAVFFSSSGAGTFNQTSCHLSGTGTTASCFLTYTPIAIGTGQHAIFSTYGGDSTHMSSSGSTIVTVPTSPVGGMEIPIDKLALLLPFLPLTSLLLGGAVVMALFKKRHSDKGETNPIDSNITF